MGTPGDWTFTSYRLVPRDEAGRRAFWSGSFAPGQTARLFPAPRVFAATAGGGPGAAVEVSESGEPVDDLVTHQLAQPARFPHEPGLDAFAVGRLVSARIEPRMPTTAGEAILDVNASLSCAFQVARVSVTGGSSLRAARGWRRFVVRLGMKRREDQPAFVFGMSESGDFPWRDCGSVYPPRVGYGYGYGYDEDLCYMYGRHNYGDSFGWGDSYRYDYGYGARRTDYGYGYGYQEDFLEQVACPEGLPISPAGHGGQRFDRLRGRELRLESGRGGLVTDLEPRQPRTISIGCGWESADDPVSDAFAQIVAGRATPFTVVDCRRPAGWCQDFDLSCLLDAPARAVPGPVTFWVGLWVTSNERHPLDFPQGGPELRLPDKLHERETRYWVPPECAAMGFWRLFAY
jgi:hypothetical protein